MAQDFSYSHHLHLCLRRFEYWYRRFHPGSDCLEMLGLRCSLCMSCLNNRMLNSGYSFLIFQVLKHMFVSMCSLFRVKAVFCLLLHPPFEMGYISIWKTNMDIFSIYWIALLIFVFRLCISLISLFHLPNFSKPYTPTFEHVNSIEVGPQHFFER